MNHYRIRYCQENGNGGYEEVTPNIATVFRIFRDGNHVKNIYPLSTANNWIKADILHHRLFPKLAARLDAYEREQAIMAGQ